MKLPNLEKAYVPPEKVTDYLLNIDHEEGHSKARFLIHFGFSVAKWEELADALIRHARQHEVVKSESTRFGTRYVIEGQLDTPLQRSPHVRVVWFISSDDAVGEFGQRRRCPYKDTIWVGTRPALSA